MIQCLPIGLCSWSFSVKGEGLDARTQHEWLTEAGEMYINNERFLVGKKGLLNPVWEVVKAAGDEQVVMSATKDRFLSKSFKIHSLSSKFLLGSESPLSRNMKLTGDGCESIIAPHHYLTKRSTIMGCEDEKFSEVKVFAFWLTVILWKRHHLSHRV